MKIDESFVLKKGETLILKKKKGYLYLEFTRKTENYLEDIIELDYRNSRSKKKDPTVWITEKDLLGRIRYEMSSGGFEFHKLESNKKNNKKNQNDSK